MEPKDIHMYIMYCVTFGFLSPAFTEGAMHFRVQELIDNGYMGEDNHLTDKGRKAITFATKKAGEI